MKCHDLLPLENNKNKIKMSCAVVVTNALTFTTLWANLADDKLKQFFSDFSPKTRPDISCKETIYSKRQGLFSGKNDKNQNVVC